MIKSSRKINNIVKGFLFLGSCVGASAFVWANPMDECAEEEYSSSVNLEKGTVQRAQKIVNLALFDAIDQGSLKGVTFLIERGADPKAENKRGRTPLDLAEHLAEKHPDEQVYRKIADSLRDWDSEQYAVDDETIVNTARKIWGLNGGENGASSAGGGGEGGNSGMRFSGSFSNFSSNAGGFAPGQGILKRELLGNPSMKASDVVKQAISDNNRCYIMQRAGGDRPSTGPSMPSADREVAHAAARVENFWPEPRLSGSSAVSSSKERAQGSMLTKIGEMAVECIPGGSAYQILDKGGSLWDATKSLAADAAMTYAGVKFLKVGGKVATKVGGKVFELVKEGSKVLLKEGRKELGKAFDGPKLKPALAGPAAKLPQTPNKDRPNILFSKNAGKPGSSSGKITPAKPTPKVERKGATGYKEGTAWEKLKSVDSSEMKRKIGTVKKEAFGGGEMRTDGKNLYRFDRAHVSGKIHLEKYEKSGKGWKSVAECDPKTLAPIPGSEAKVANRKPIKW